MHRSTGRALRRTQVPTAERPWGRVVALPRRVLFGGLLLLGLSSLSGCTKPAFTCGVRDQLSLSLGNIQRLQFFTSEDILLERESLTQTKAMTDHGVVVRDEMRIDEVLIDAGTPGIAIRVEDNYLLVSFARGDSTRSLWFGTPPIPGEEFAADSSPYSLVQLENDAAEPGPFVPRASTGFLVRWGGQLYRVSRGRRARLLYDLDSSFEQERVRSKAKGWRLSDGEDPSLPRGLPFTSPTPSSAPSGDVSPEAPGASSPSRGGAPPSPSPR